MLMPVALVAEPGSSASRRWQMLGGVLASRGRAPLLPRAGPSALGEHVMDSFGLLVWSVVVDGCAGPLQVLRVLRAGRAGVAGSS